MQPNFASCASGRKATAAERHLPFEHCLVHLTRFLSESFGSCYFWEKSTLLISLWSANDGGCGFHVLYLNHV